MIDDLNMVTNIDRSCDVHVGVCVRVSYGYQICGLMSCTLGMRTFACAPLQVRSNIDRRYFTSYIFVMWLTDRADISTDRPRMYVFTNRSTLSETNRKPVSHLLCEFVCFLCFAMHPVNLSWRGAPQSVIQRGFCGR